MNNEVSQEQTDATLSKLQIQDEVSLVKGEFQKGVAASYIHPKVPVVS